MSTAPGIAVSFAAGGIKWEVAAWLPPRCEGVSNAMLVRTLTTLGAVIAAAALLTSIASVWLVLADPVGVAQTVDSGGVQAFVEALAGAIAEAVGAVVRWL